MSLTRPDLTLPTPPCPDLLVMPIRALESAGCEPCLDEPNRPISRLAGISTLCLLRPGRSDVGVRSALYRPGSVMEGRA